MLTDPSQRSHAIIFVPAPFDAHHQYERWFLANAARDLLQFVQSDQLPSMLDEENLCSEGIDPSAEGIAQAEQIQCPTSQD